MIVDKHKIYLKMARDYSQMSKCRKIKVGCLIVNNGRIISTGANGVNKGACDCTDHFYAHNDAQFAKAHHEWSKDHEIHAEMNAILYTAKSNAEINSDCVLYCTHEPCNNCLKHIAVTGIKRIYFIEKYYGNTIDNKYKLDIKQLDIDDEPKKLNTNVDLFFDYGKSQPKHIKPIQPIPIILNARRIFYEYCLITLDEIIELCGFKVTKENRKYYYADCRKNGEMEFKNIPADKILILQNEMQIRCSGSIPGDYVDDGKPFGIKISD